MKIGGLVKTSLVDYPSEICITIFLNYCNFRCPYCYNVDLVFGKNEISEEEVLSFLAVRRKLLNHVCISGGEPLLDESIIPFLEKIKALGFNIKIDTNGANPDLLKKVIDYRLVDYVAMDLKTSLDKYHLVIDNKLISEKINESIKILKMNVIDYNFRTTVALPLVSEKDIYEIADIAKGSKRFYLQQFVPDHCLSMDHLTVPSREIMESYRKIINKKIPEVIVNYTTPEK